MNNAKLYDNVQLMECSIYASSSFQQEGFGHLKLGKTGDIVKFYDDGTYLIQFIDEGVEKSNIYSEKDIKLI
jgi:hypothetical protein